ncbi:MAG TPA: TatD family hydrolase [Streptosporangiaceae bacterium]|nr:TatD family hydrolase [Streptosporangiaceae bacterium]
MNDQYRRPPAPEPEPLPATAFDGHCHLDLLPGPVSAVVARAGAAGISRMITVGCDLPSSYWAVTCAADHDEVYAAVAIHPNETTKVAATPAERDAVLAEIAELAAQPLVLAVGETGLDYYWDDAPHELQQEWFRAHIAIAKAVGKPLMIHDRDAHQDVLDILAAEGPPDQVIFHCFSGDPAMAARCAEAGYVLSFAGTLTFANAPQLREAAAVIPAELALVETDAPFLTPVPNRGKSNSPAQVAHTVRALAAIKELDVAELCAIIEANGERVFGPWPVSAGSANPAGPVPRPA